MSIGIKSVHEGPDMVMFWQLFDKYISELAKDASMGDGIDLAYYRSNDYREAVHRILDRPRNPIRIFLAHNEDDPIGFSMYQLLFDESRHACLMEFYIMGDQRLKGFGGALYEAIEDKLRAEGVKTIDLTPTNEGNRSFWTQLGYVETAEVDEDHKPIYLKRL